MMPAGIKKEHASIEWCSTEPAFIQNPLSDLAAKGKSLFMGKCAACHTIFKNSTGPSLKGFEERGPWTERKSLYAWIRNPSAFLKKNKYARDLSNQYNGTMMTAFPDITDAEIDAIREYIISYGQLQQRIPTTM